MTNAPNDPPDTDNQKQEADMAHDDDRKEGNDNAPDAPKENLVHFNPWRDFNDAAPQIDVFGDEPDPEQIARFMEVVFGY